MPHSLKNAAIPMGDTLIGVYGKKYLVLSKGDKSAMPNPPDVNASKIPWVEVKTKKYVNNPSLLLNFISFDLKNNKTTIRDNMKAKVIE